MALRDLVAKLFDLGVPEPKPPHPDPNNLRPGQIKCKKCSATGSYHNGYVRLFCHRCDGTGVTTPDRDLTAENWERCCAFHITGNESRIAILAYQQARSKPL